MRNVPNRSSATSRRSTPARPRIVLHVGSSGRRDHIPPVVWERPDMRRFLVDHDIAGVYRLLHRHGVSQRAIAARTGQAQSEISEIISRGREVHSYELLVRIGEGLGLPRGWMGLAYDESSLPYLSSGGRS